MRPFEERLEYYLKLLGTDTSDGVTLSLESNTISISADTLHLLQNHKWRLEWSKALCKENGISTSNTKAACALLLRERNPRLCQIGHLLVSITKHFNSGEYGDRRTLDTAQMQQLINALEYTGKQHYALWNVNMRRLTMLIYQAVNVAKEEHLIEVQRAASVACQMAKNAFQGARDASDLAAAQVQLATAKEHLVVAKIEAKWAEVLVASAHMDVTAKSQARKAVRSPSGSATKSFTTPSVGSFTMSIEGANLVDADEL